MAGNQELLCRIEGLGLETFEGEWEEHEALDDWILDAMMNGHLLDEDTDMEDAVEEEHFMDIEMNEYAEWSELNHTQDGESTFEDWLENELCEMDVDGETRDLVFGLKPSKPQPHRLPEAFVRIGLVPPRESHPPVTAVGIWGPEGNAGIGHVTDKVGPFKIGHSVATMNKLSLHIINHFELSFCLDEYINLNVDSSQTIYQV